MEGEMRIGRGGWKKRKEKDEMGWHTEELWRARAVGWPKDRQRSFDRHQLKRVGPNLKERAESRLKMQCHERRQHASAD